VRCLPLRRFAQDAWLYPTCHQTGPASHEVALTCRVLDRISLAPVLVGCSPLALHPRGLGCRVFARSGLRASSCESTRNPLMDLRPPSESSRLRAAGDSSALRRARPPHRHPPMRSPAPSASPRTGQRLFVWPGLPHRTACASRFSQPPGAFIRPVPGGLVSCHIRSWGCALQSFAPPVQPYAVSGALALLSFRRTRAPPHAHRKRPKPTTARSPAWHLRPKPVNTGPRTDAR
jgi:hypothetical protein